MQCLKNIKFNIFWDFDEHLFSRSKIRPKSRFYQFSWFYGEYGLLSLWVFRKTLIEKIIPNVKIFYQTHKKWFPPSCRRAFCSVLLWAPWNCKHATIFSLYGNFDASTLCNRWVPSETHWLQIDKADEVIRTNEKKTRKHTPHPKQHPRMQTQHTLSNSTLNKKKMMDFTNSLWWSMNE